MPSHISLKIYRTTRDNDSCKSSPNAYPMKLFGYVKYGFFNIEMITRIIKELNIEKTGEKLLNN